MRPIFIFAAVAGTALIGATPSLAANAAPPWCLKAVSDGLAVDYCDYRTFEQCAQERFNYGNKSYCFNNKAYFFSQSGPGEPPRKSRRKMDQ